MTMVKHTCHCLGLLQGLLQPPCETPTSCELCLPGFLFYKISKKGEGKISKNVTYIIIYTYITKTMIIITTSFSPTIIFSIAPPWSQIGTWWQEVNCQKKVELTVKPTWKKRTNWLFFAFLQILTTVMTHMYNLSLHPRWTADLSSFHKILPVWS